MYYNLKFYKSYKFILRYTHVEKELIQHEFNMGVKQEQRARVYIIQLEDFCSIAVK